MPSPEASLQRNLFTGELVDTRSPRQKRLGRIREQPHQSELFSQREIAQFGVKARPLMPLSATTRMALVKNDLRTAEEKDRDTQLAAEAHTHRMFAEQVLGDEHTRTGEDIQLNDVALVCLEALRQDSQGRSQSVDYYLYGLWTIWNTERDNEIAHRANRIWALHDEAALQVEFKRRPEASALSFDLVDFEPGHEAWWAAWQLALEDIDVSPPLLPTFSRVTIKTWLEGHEHEALS